MSVSVKPLTGSLNNTVTGIGVVAVGLPTAEDIDTDGFSVSITRANPPDATEVFPATSVACAVTLYPLSGSRPLVILQLPPPARPEPTGVAPANNWTVLPPSAVPVKFGVFFLVMPSEFEVPVSSAESKTGVDGALGDVVSITTCKLVEAPDWLPARSVAVV